MSTTAFCRILLVSVTVAILTLALMPAPPSSANLGWDKANHVVAMAVVMILALLSLRPVPRRVLLAGLYTLLLGALIEVLQALLTTTRCAEWSDLAADGAGILMVAGTLQLLHHRRTRFVNMGLMMSDEQN